MGTESKSGSNSRMIIILVIVLIVVAGAVAIVFMLTRGSGDSGETVDVAQESTSKIGYAEGVVALDEESLQAAVDAAAEKSRNSFTTDYRNDAYSTDGETFSCHIGNSALNAYDMYIQIFADDEYTDQLFLSKLVRPGTAFEEITLDHPLDPGVHRVYVVYTQVDEEESIAGQSAITMDFHVTE